MFNLVICCNLHRSFLIQVSTSTKCNLYIISIPCRTGTLFMATKEPPLLTLKTLSNVCNHSVLIYISYDIKSKSRSDGKIPDSDSAIQGTC